MLKLKYKVMFLKLLLCLFVCLCVCLLVCFFVHLFVCYNGFFTLHDPSIKLKYPYQIIFLWGLFSG